MNAQVEALWLEYRAFGELDYTPILTGKAWDNFYKIFEKIHFAENPSTRQLQAAREAFDAAKAQTFHL